MAANPFVGANVAKPSSIGGSQSQLTETDLTWDTEIRPSAGDLIGGNVMISYGVGVGMAIRKRVLLAIPVRGHYTAAHLRFELFSNSPATGFNLVAVPIVSELAKLGDFNDISFNNVDASAVDAWDVPGVQTAGAGTSPGNNVDNDHRAVFAIPDSGWAVSDTVAFADSGSGAVADHVVNPSSGSMAAVFNRARKAATEQGVAYATVMLVHEDETLGTSMVNFRGLNGIGAKPSFGGVASAMPYDGLVMATRPNLYLNTLTTCPVQVMFGHLDFAVLAGSTFAIEYSDDPLDLPTGSAATGGIATSPYTVAGSEVFGGHADFVMDSALQPATITGCFYYRVRATIGGVAYYGPISIAPLVVPPGVAFQSGIEGDRHQIRAMNAIGDSDAESLQVQDASCLRVRSLCDGSANHPRYWIAGGDTWGFCQTNQSTKLWPMTVDGSGLAAGGTSNIPLSEEQTRQTFIAQIVNSLFPRELCPTHEVPGNHLPSHAHAFSVNNGGQTNVGQWALNALIEFGFIPPATPIVGYDQPVGEEGRGHYAFVCGNTQTIVGNSGRDSLRSDAADPAIWVGGYPISLDDPLNWKASAVVTAWRNGLLITSPAISLTEYWHSAMIGVSFGVPQKYDRSDPYKLDTGFRESALNGPLNASKFRNRCFNFYFHDHVHQAKRVKSVAVMYCATFGEVGSDDAINGGPYGHGFGGPMLHRRDQEALSNAGIYRLFHGPQSVTVKYVATIKSDTTPKEWITPPPDGEWSEPAYADSLLAMGIADGDVVAAMTVPDISIDARDRTRDRVR